MLKRVYKLFFLLLILTPLLGYNKIEYNNKSELQIQTTYLTNWTASDNLKNEFGKGRFYYRILRSTYPVDKNGNYLYEIYFISDSYYIANYYDINKNGIVELTEIYRSSTRIESISLAVNNIPYNNTLTNSSTFWLLFKGNYENGVGDLGITFRYPSANPKITFTWKGLKPY